MERMPYNKKEIARLALTVNTTDFSENTKFQWKQRGSTELLY